MNIFIAVAMLMVSMSSQYRSRSRLNEPSDMAKLVEALVSQYRSRSRLNEQHRFQWIRFSCEIMLFRSHPHSQWLTSFVHLVRKGNGFCVINQDIPH